MADFDAGSIEGRLDLDTDPFIDGLRKAKAEAQRFERERYTATIATHYETTGDAPDPNRSQDQSTTVNIGADTSDFDADAVRVQAELERLDREEANPEVNLDTRRSVASAARLRDEMGRFRSEIGKDDNRFSQFMHNLDMGLNRTAGAYKSSTPGVPGSGHGLMMLVGLAAALAPALGPATAAVGLFGAASVAAFGGAAVSMALYAKVAGSAFKIIQDANAEGKSLSGWAGKAQTALGGLTRAWHDMQAQVNPGIFMLMTHVFQQLTPWIHRLVPLLNAISTGLSGAFDAMGNALGGGPFEKFMALLRSNALKDLPLLGDTIGHAFNGLMGIFIALNPVIQVMVRWFDRMSSVFDNWANTKAPGAVTDLFDTVQKYGPLTLKMLSSLGDFLVHLGQDFAPLTGPALHFLTSLAKGLASLDLAPFTAGIGAVMGALRPFLGVIASLVNVLLPPLGVLLSTIADSFVGPLGRSLRGALNPALDALASVLGVLAPVLGDVIATFADLINPTGVNLFVEAIVALQGPIETLLPPLGRLIMALESMVDIGLEALTPVIGPLGSALQVLASALVPVINTLSAILEYEPVVYILLAIAAAIKVWAAVQWVLNAALFANPIGLVIVAVAALVIGIIALWQHSETFRNICYAVWDVLKQIASDMAGTFVAAWHLAGKAISFLKDHLELLLVIIGPLGLAILAVIEIVKHWAGVTHIVHSAWTKVLNFFQAIPGKIKGWFAQAGSWLLSAGSAIIRGLWNGLMSYWRVVLGFYGSVGSKIKGWFSGAAGWLVSLGSQIIHGLWNGLNSYWHIVTGFYASVGSKIKGWFSGASGWLLDVGYNIIQGLWNGLSSRFDSLYSWASGKIEALVGLFHKIPGVSSPAKRLIFVGEMMGAGLHIGLASAFERHVLPTARDGMNRLMKVLHGAADIGVSGAIDISQTGTQAQIGTLAASVAALTGAHNRSSAATMDTLATVLGELVKAVESGNEDLLDTLTEAYERAGNKQMTKLITHLRTNR